MPPTTLESNDAKIAYLDGWRGLAIVMVLISHFIVRFSWFGGFGVELFFVLSGFLMSRLLFIKMVPLRTFFIRRFARVIPTFFLFTTVAYVYARTLQPVKFEVPLPEFFSTLVFLRTYFPADESIWAGHWPIGHFWSLNIEEHSYIWLAFGMFVFGRVKSKYAIPAFLIASLIATFLFRLHYKSEFQSEGSNWTLYSQCAAYGLLASACYRILLERNIIRLPHEITPLLSVVCFFVAIVIYIPNEIFHSGVLASLLLAVSINHMSDAPDFAKRALSLSALRWFGICSYSIYLWQQPVMLLPDSLNIHPWLFLPLAISLGAISFYFFEDPIRKSINNRRSPNASA